MIIDHTPQEINVDEQRQAAFRDKSAWFAAFLKNTDQKETQKRALIHGLQEEYPDVWEKVLNPNYPFTSVFVGVGNGGLEVPLMQEFIKARGSSEHFEIFCEDPSEQMREGFFIAAEKEGITELVKEYSLEPFEESTYEAPQADLVLGSHVWYYIKKWQNVSEKENSLAKFANSLSERSGVGLITLQSNTSDRYLLLANYALYMGGQKDVAGEDLGEELQRLGISHRLEIVEAHTSLKSCFKEGTFDPQEEGKNLLSFFLRTPWDDLSPAMKELITLNILSMVQANGKEELIFRDCYIWITKL